eukprot:1837769-Rhodomonas_salina.1
MLLHVLGNALKFTEEGAVKFTVRLDREKKTLVYVIEDTGPGIPEGQKDRIWGAFNQVRARARGRVWCSVGLPCVNVSGRCMLLLLRERSICSAVEASALACSALHPTFAASPLSLSLSLSLFSPLLHEHDDAQLSPSPADISCTPPLAAGRRGHGAQARRDRARAHARAAAGVSAKREDHVRLRGREGHDVYDRDARQGHR